MALIPVLVDVCTKGYGMLRDARNVGEDWGDLEWRREIIEERFNDWAEKMRLRDDDLDLSALFGPNSKKHTLVVKTLAKIVECFRKIDEFKLRYEAVQPMAAETSTLSTGPEDVANTRTNEQQKRKRADSSSAGQQSQKRSRVRSFLSSLKSNTSGSTHSSFQMSALEIRSSIAAPDTPTNHDSTSEMNYENPRFPSAKVLETLPEIFQIMDEAEARMAMEGFKEIAQRF
ncbi:hypothetical protein RUND412_006645 [Rhizina undulata]